MTYQAIADSEIDLGSPITEPLMGKLRDNPLAMNSGDVSGGGAPINAYAWHPNDMVNIGDGNDGAFYDFASDGIVTQATTPVLSDGWEYAIYFNGLVSASGTFTIQVSRSTTTAFTTWFDMTGYGASAATTGIFVVLRPRMSLFAHSGRWMVPLSSSSASNDEGYASALLNTTRQAITQLRVTGTGANLTAGKLHLLRRRDVLTA